jgi:hypothetical protein
MLRIALVKAVKRVDLQCRSRVVARVEIEAALRNHLNASRQLVANPGVAMFPTPPHALVQGARSVSRPASTLAPPAAEPCRRAPLTPRSETSHNVLASRDLIRILGAGSKPFDFVFHCGREVLEKLAITISRLFSSFEYGRGRCRSWQSGKMDQIWYLIPR